MLHNLVFSSLNGFKLIDFIIRLQIYCFFFKVPVRICFIKITERFILYQAPITA